MPSQCPTKAACGVRLPLKKIFCSNRDKTKQKNTNRLAVCQDDWNDAASQTFCRSLGLSGDNAITGSFLYSATLDRIELLRRVTCSGEEQHLSECHIAIGITDDVSKPGFEPCPSDEAIGVLCSDAMTATTTTERPASANLQVRLVRGVNAYRGLVEVRVGNFGQWGRVCINLGAGSAEDTACRMVGRGDGYAFRAWSDGSGSSASYGASTGPVILVSGDVASEGAYVGMGD